MYKESVADVTEPFVIFLSTLKYVLVSVLLDYSFVVIMSWKEEVC